MLVLSRKLNENIMIGDQIVVKVLKLGLDSIRIGIEAPSHIPVHRQELYEEICRTNQKALAHVGQPLPKVKRKVRREASLPPPDPVAARFQDSPANF